jgi:hypothetical protein
LYKTVFVVNKDFCLVLVLYNYCCFFVAHNHTLHKGFLVHMNSLYSVICSKVDSPSENSMGKVVQKHFSLTPGLVSNSKHTFHILFVNLALNL